MLNPMTTPLRSLCRQALLVAGCGCALAAAASAGNTIQVPSQQPTIQAAVNSAAAGDLILVAPGTYAPFSVDGTVHPSLTIAGSAGWFGITDVANTPEITVSNMPMGSKVTIQGAFIQYFDHGAPAVKVSNNAGAVRLLNLDVDQNGDLILGTTAQACVEVDGTDTFWMVDSSIWSFVARDGYTVNPLSAGGFTNEGVSGLQLTESDGIIQNSRMRGYRNDGNYSGAAGFAGDGLRAIGNCNLWLLEDNLQPLYAGEFKGGDGIFGGNAVHQVLSPATPNLIRSCGGPDGPNTIPLGLLWEPGLRLFFGQGRIGGFYGFNNGNGSASVGGAVAFKVVKHCKETELNENSMPSEVISVGTPMTIQIRTRKNRRYVCLLTLSTLYTPGIGGLSGRAMINPVNPLLVLTGNTVGQTPTTINIPVPNVAGLAGLQITVQSAFGPVGGGLDNLGLPALAILVP